VLLCLNCIWLNNLDLVLGDVGSLPKAFEAIIVIYYVYNICRFQIIQTKLN
jgi:hypothetical protein